MTLVRQTIDGLVTLTRLQRGRYQTKLMEDKGIELRNPDAGRNHPWARYSIHDPEG